MSHVLLSGVQNILDQMNAQSLVLAEVRRNRKSFHETVCSEPQEVQVATQYSTATSDGQDPDSPAAEV